MIETTKINLAEAVLPAISLVPDQQLKRALENALFNKAESIALVEECFAGFADGNWSIVNLSTFFNGWKATHLKMLAIYGLSCRLQREAMASDGEKRDHLMIAAAQNAETSYEDLGLDFNGETHSELYDQMVGTFLNNDTWKLSSFDLPMANEFKNWIYHNMVVDPDPLTGLLTNMFSEIYNTW